MPLRLAILHLLGFAIFECRRLRLQIAIAFFRKAIVLDAHDGT